MAYNFRNFVFEGGGVKGIAYIGALVHRHIISDTLYCHALGNNTID